MGKREIMLVLSILLLLVGSSKGLNEFDYYQVIFQWQPAACSSATLKSPCVKRPENRFTIHGVWPSLTSGNATKCSGTPPYDGNKIYAIRSRLDQDWPSVVYGTNPTLWSHEWKTHGTCSNYYLDQYNYFNFGLSVFGKYNMISILRKYGINPDGNDYSIDYIESAIYNATVKWPALRCNKNKSSGKKQLYEIALCFTKVNRALQDCPYNAVTCGNKFSWNS